MAKGGKTIKRGGLNTLSRTGFGIEPLFHVASIFASAFGLKPGHASRPGQDPDIETAFWNKTPGFAIFIVTLLTYSAAFGAPAHMVKKVRSGVVTINVYNEKMTLTESGNGFFINRSGEIISNYHVFKDAHYSEIITARGTKYPIERIVAENPYKDLIKVRVNIPPNRIAPLSLRASELRLKEPVFVISRAQGVKCRVTNGVVTSIRGNSVQGNDDMLQITAPLSSGSSGSPVFDLNGQVVGVATAYWRTGRKFNFAVMSRHIAGLDNFAILKAHSQWQPRKNKNPNAKWYVETDPSDAAIRILNISRAFTQGIELTAGRYQIEVSRKGYHTYKDWVTCESGETKKLKIFLTKAPLDEGQDLVSKWMDLIQHLKAASVEVLEHVSHDAPHRTGA
jgi:hypothetical protein